jgi:hypothetical protein
MLAQTPVDGGGMLLLACGRPLGSGVSSLGIREVKK